MWLENERLPYRVAFNRYNTSTSLVQVSQLTCTDNCISYRFAYAPYQLFKTFGIPHPPVTPFFGNTLQIHKQVSSSIYYSKAISLYRVFWNQSMNGLRNTVKCLGKWIKLMSLLITMICMAHDGCCVMLCIQLYS